MNRRFHKRALSAAAALLTLSSAVGTVNAAQRNAITIESSKNSVNSGDTLEVTVGYEPDGTGVSGFTIDLHYDPEAVTLNVPNTDDYEMSGGFAIVTNFEYEDGTVRIVGANLSGSNVKVSTVLADLSFTVNSGYYGDVNFWTEVDTLVATDGDSFTNAEFTAYSQYSPYTVEGPSQPVQTTTTTVATTTAPVQTTAPETTTTVTEQPLPETVIPVTTIIPETTAAPESTVESVQTSESGVQENDEVQASDSTMSASALFVHTQGDEDYNNEEALQFTFSPDEYVESTAETVDISVEVESSGYAKGGIGMLTSSGWKIYPCEVAGGESAVWTAENVDLSDVTGDIAVQLYYLKHDSEFAINSVSVSLSDSEDTAEGEETLDTDSDYPDNDYTETDVESTVVDGYYEDDSYTDVDTDSVTETEIDTDSDTDTDTDYTDYDEAYTETVADESDVTADSESDEQDTAESVDEGGLSDGYGSDYEQSNAENTAESTADSTTDSTTSTADTTQTSTDTTAVTQGTTATEVESAVAVASATADSNPDTGVSVSIYICGGIMVLCAAQICYSVYALVKRK